MQKIKPLAVMLLGLGLSAGPVQAVTLEEIAAKNNKIIELDQEIVIAEKNKKLAEIKASYGQSDTIVLPKIGTVRHEDHIAVIAVHGAPVDPIVDVQYGATLLQKKRGEVLPDGWQIADVEPSSVVFIKKAHGKKPPLIKKIAIGREQIMKPDDGLPIGPTVPTVSTVPLLSAPIASPSGR